MESFLFLDVYQLTVPTLSRTKRLSKPGSRMLLGGGSCGWCVGRRRQANKLGLFHIEDRTTPARNNVDLVISSSLSSRAAPQGPYANPSRSYIAALYTLLFQSTSSTRLTLLNLLLPPTLPATPTPPLHRQHAPSFAVGSCVSEREARTNNQDIGASICLSPN